MKENRIGKLEKRIDRLESKLSSSNSSSWCSCHNRPASACGGDWGHGVEEDYQSHQNEDVTDI